MRLRYAAALDPRSDLVSCVVDDVTCCVEALLSGRSICSADGLK